MPEDAGGPLRFTTLLFSQSIAHAAVPSPLALKVQNVTAETPCALSDFQKRL